MPEGTVDWWQFGPAAGLVGTFLVLLLAGKLRLEREVIAAVKERDERIAEKNAVIAEKNAVITQQQVQIARMTEVLNTNTQTVRDAVAGFDRALEREHTPDQRRRG